MEIKQLCRLSVNIAFVFLCVISCSGRAWCQLVDFNNTGFPDNGVFDGDDFESVQLNNLNLHIEIPVWGTKGRGPGAWAKYVYDGNNWYYKTVCSPHGMNCTDKVTPQSPFLQLVLPWSYTAKE